MIISKHLSITYLSITYANEVFNISVYKHQNMRLRINYHTIVKDRNAIENKIKVYEIP